MPKGSPKYFTRDPVTGAVLFDFDGHVHATGLELDADTVFPPNIDNRIDWIRQSDGGRVATMGGSGIVNPNDRYGRAVIEANSDDVTNHGVRSWAQVDLNATRNTGVGGAAEAASVRAAAGTPSENATAVVINESGQSDFLKHNVVQAHPLSDLDKAIINNGQFYFVPDGTASTPLQVDITTGADAESWFAEAGWHVQADSANWTEIHNMVQFNVFHTDNRYTGAVGGQFNPHTWVASYTGAGAGWGGWVTVKVTAYIKWIPKNTSLSVRAYSRVPAIFGAVMASRSVKGGANTAVGGTPTGDATTYIRAWRVSN